MVFFASSMFALKTKHFVSLIKIIFINYSIICPSVEMIITLHGRNFPLYCKAVFTAFSMPP